MSCLNPSRIKNPRYKKMNIKELSAYCREFIGIQYCIVDSTGIHPPDEYIEIPCGTCFACQKRKRKEIQFRLIQELLSHKQSTFITLTFDEKYLEEFKDDYKRPLMLYIDRLRKHLGYRPKYWFTSEFGDENHHTGRLHFHGFLFGTSPKDLPYKVQREKWFYGISWTEPALVDSCSYATKYITKQLDGAKTFRMSSNGIGLSYVNKKTFYWHLNNFDPRMYCQFLGKKFPLSNYYKSKLFDDHLKSAFMVNRFFDMRPREYWVGSFKYEDYDKYLSARRVYFEDTVRRGSSLLPRHHSIVKNILEADSWQLQHWLPQTDLTLF